MYTLQFLFLIDCMSSRWGTTRCGVHATCLLARLLSRPTLAHQPSWAWARWRV